jgi:competence protein ComFA
VNVRLYAAAISGKLEWRISLHIGIDSAYWFGQYGGKASLHLLEPVLSLGEAFGLLESLGAQNGSGNLEADLRKMAAFGEQMGFRIGAMNVRTMTYAQYAAAAERPTEIDTLELLRMEQLLAGRCFSREELLSFLQHHGLHTAAEQWTSYLQAAYLRGRVQLARGVSCRLKRRLLQRKPERHYRCERCGSEASHLYPADCVRCSGECVYCEACLTMGRMQSCSLLVYGSAVSSPRRGSGESPEKFISRWGLSPAQAEAARHGLSYLASGGKGEKGGKPGTFLIWAVTGAGKTETIFPFIDFELQRGGRVLIATPRRDVVLELQPRIKRAFAERTVVTLYGGSEERWNVGEITIATTHQLLRFYRSFDLVVIDEIDAFPYHNNPMLQYAAERVCTEAGNYVLLSATPPDELVRAANRNRLAHVKVPVRFHRHPLPVPVKLAVKKVIYESGKGLPANVKAALRHSIERGAQIFVFVPRIRDVETAVSALRSSFSGLEIDGTSSQDPERADKVMRFRQGQIRILVTTTILERGVTVPKTDVFIMNADSSTFDSAALIQMAGRAGRSKDDPAGRVFFVAKAYTNSQARAIREIRRMNRLAKRKGYLLASGEGERR